MEEEGEVSDRESTKAEQYLDQEFSEEQTSRETIRGVRTFLGWKQVPEFESSSSSLDDNLFAGTRAKPTSKVSVKLPSDKWLCRKMEKLNISVTEGYPYHSSETLGLARDQFVRDPKTQKWYDMYAEKKDFSRSKVHCWMNELARLNSFFTRVARHSLPSAPTSRPIHQDTLRKWERSARDQSYMCNQAAGLSRCLTKVQDAIASQLKVIQTYKAKEKSASKTQEATDKLGYLMTFNRSFAQAMATLITIRNSPLQMSSLFLDHLLAKAEEQI